MPPTRPTGGLSGLLCVRAGVPAIRMHDLRHLHNTTLMGEGVSPKVVKERAGMPVWPSHWSSTVWVTPDLQEVAVEALSRSLARTPAPLPADAATGMLPDPGAIVPRAAWTT